jgi:regulatory protein
MYSSDRKITEIRADKKKSYCVIFINHEPFLKIHTDIAIRLNLYKGMKINEQLLDSIISENTIMEVKEKAFKYTSYKPRTRQQVITKLRQYNFDEKYISNALGFLQEYKLLDDDKYAFTFAKEYLKRKPSGYIKIYSELLKRGIPSELAKKAATEAVSESDMLETALRAARKKMKTIRGKNRDKKYQTLRNHLFRLGFDRETINSVLNQTLK